MKNPFEWYREYKKWNADHVATWTGMTDISESRLSKFQEKAEPIILSRLEKLGILVSKRTIEGNNEHWLLLSLAKQPFSIAIYIDQINLFGEGIDVRLEEWDAKTPEDLILLALNQIEKHANHK